LRQVGGFLQFPPPIKLTTTIYNVIEILLKVVCIVYLKVRDEYRTDYDEGRGGYGKIIQTKIRTKDTV
jgi:ribosomal protein L17